GIFFPVGENPLEFLRSQAQFQTMRQVIQQNPSLLPALLQQLGQDNPQLQQTHTHTHKTVDYAYYSFCQVQHTHTQSHTHTHTHTAGEPHTETYLYLSHIQGKGWR